MSGKKGSGVSATERHASVSQEPVTSVLQAGEVVYDPEDPDRKWDADEEVLAALGYKPEFKREFNLFTTFSVSFAVLGLLPSFATTLYYGMGYAGTPGVSRIPTVFKPGKTFPLLTREIRQCNSTDEM